MYAGSTLSICQSLNSWICYMYLNLLEKHFHCFQPESKIVSLLPAASPINYLLLRLSLSFSNKSYLFLDVIRKNFLVISLLDSLFWNGEIKFVAGENSTYYYIGNCYADFTFWQLCLEKLLLFHLYISTFDQTFHFMYFVADSFHLYWSCRVVFPLLPMLQTQLCFVTNKNWLPNY